MRRRLTLFIACLASGACAPEPHLGARPASAWIAQLEAVQAQRRGEAAFMLRHLDSVPPPLWTALTRRLRDPDHEVRTTAFNTIAILAREATVVPPQLEAALSHRLLHQPRDSDERQRLVHLLGVIGARSALARATLEAAMLDSSDHVRCAASASLTGGAHPILRPTLMHAHQHDASACVRAESLSALVAYAADSAGAERVAHLARLALTDASPLVREHAAYALAALGPRSPNTDGALLAAIRDSVSSVRAAAAQALGTLGGRAPDVTQHIEALRSLAADPSRDVRTASARALAVLVRHQ